MSTQRFYIGQAVVCAADLRGAGIVVDQAFDFSGPRILSVAFLPVGSATLACRAAGLLACPPDRIAEARTALGRDARERLLVAAVREVVTAPGDDICWYDAFSRLAWLAGVEFDPAMIPPDQMKAQCNRFVDSLAAGAPYATDKLTEIARDHREAMEYLAWFAGTEAAAGRTLVDLVTALVVEVKEARTARAHVAGIRKWLDGKSHKGG